MLYQRLHDSAIRLTLSIKFTLNLMQDDPTVESTGENERPAAQGDSPIRRIYRHEPGRLAKALGRGLNSARGQANRKARLALFGVPPEHR
mgnify:CR=1 FL=1